jgi:CubicO group peptidase (beta-lactamase class C family)
MKKKASIIVLWALLIGIKGMAQINQISKKQIADINQFVEDLSNNDKFSGTVLIAKGNKILYQKAVGLADKEHNSKNNIDTKFNLASMNKMFTGIAIAQLVEKNKLNYSDKVVKYLSNLPEKTFGKITIEQLLTHTAGTGDFFRMPTFMDMKDTAKTIASYVNLGINEPLLFEPGAKFQYSNYGYILLGAVIEKISKTSYFDYVKKNIFAIANMKNTDSYETDKTNKNMAIGYDMPPSMPNQAPTPMGEKILREPTTQFIEVKGTSAGGGYSTAIDLQQFSSALLTSKLLSAKSVATITTGKIAMPKPPTPPNVKPMPEIKYGFGFGEFYKNNIRIIGHNGGAPGVDVQLDIYPDVGYTVIVLSNYGRAIMPIINFIEDSITKNPTGEGLRRR